MIIVSRNTYLSRHIYFQMERSHPKLPFSTPKSTISRNNMCKIATSLGGVETIIQYSVSMTHSTRSSEARAAGVSVGLLRLSAGIEHIDDRKRDFEHVDSVLTYK